MCFDTHVAQLADALPVLLRNALSRGATFADLFYEYTVRHRGVLRWEGGRLHAPSFNRQHIEGAGWHVIGSAVGYASTQNLQLSALRQVALDAARQAGGRRLCEPAPLQVPVFHPDLPPDAPHDAGEDEKLAVLRQALDAACGLDGHVRRVVVEWRDRVQRCFIATSEGMLATKAFTSVGLRVTVTYTGTHGTATAQAVASGTGGMSFFLTHPPERVGGEAVARAQHTAAAHPLLQGGQFVVLAPEVAGVWLHEAVGHALEADVAGAPPLATRLAPAGVTIVDDATLPGGCGTYAFDDEGTPAQRTLLVEDGILRARLTNRHWADRCSLPRTGNARRQDYRYPPLPRMTNLVLEPGAASPFIRIPEVREGLYVAAAQHGTSLPGGGFSLDVTEAYRIERGRHAEPLGCVRITGNSFETLANLVWISGDARLSRSAADCLKAGQVVPITTTAPTIAVKAMRVSTV